MRQRGQRQGREEVLWKLELTWNNVASIHCILVLDEPKAIHEFDFGNLAGAMSTEVGLDVGLGDFLGGSA